MQGQTFHLIMSQTFHSPYFKRNKDKNLHICENKYRVRLIRNVNLTHIFFKTIQSTPTCTGSVQERFCTCCSYHRANVIIDTRFVILEALSTDFTPKNY